MKTDVKVWDWPLRAFHWLLVVSVTGAYTTGTIGGEWTEWHARFGSAVLGLIVFRLIWGFVGTQHSRFSSFFPTWSRLSAYLRGEWHGIGHNPLGAFAVFGLLTVLLVLATTGLFANDDIGFEGPLFNRIDKDLSDTLSGWHLRSVNALMVLLALHVGAIVFYQMVKKADLIKPMVTGKKQMPITQAQTATPQVASFRLILSVTLAGAIVWAAWGGDPLRYIPPLAGVQSAHAGDKQ